MIENDNFTNTINFENIFVNLAIYLKKNNIHNLYLKKLANALNISPTHQHFNQMIKILENKNIFKLPPTLSVELSTRTMSLNYFHF